VPHEAIKPMLVTDLPSSLKVRAKRYRELSPPAPSDCVIFEKIEEEYQRKPWKRRAVNQTNEPQAWQGRGRLSFTTAVTASIDAIKCNSQRLEALEKELDLQNTQLEKILGTRQTLLAQAMAAQENTGPFHGLQPSGGQIVTKKKPLSSSQSTTKILQGLSRATPPVESSTLASFQGPIPQHVLDLYTHIQENCEAPVIPIDLKVSGTAPQHIIPSS